MSSVDRLDLLITGSKKGNTLQHGCEITTGQPIDAWTRYSTTIRMQTDEEEGDINKQSGSINNPLRRFESWCRICTLVTSYASPSCPTEQVAQILPLGGHVTVRMECQVSLGRWWVRFAGRRLVSDRLRCAVLLQWDNPRVLQPAIVRCRCRRSSLFCVKQRDPVAMSAGIPAEKEEKRKKKEEEEEKELLWLVCNCRDSMTR